MEKEKWISTTNPNVWQLSHTEGEGDKVFTFKTKIDQDTIIATINLDAYDAEDIGGVLIEHHPTAKKYTDITNDLIALYLFETYYVNSEEEYDK